MQVDSTFSVVAPIEQVWETLMDVERVAGCVPGAQVLNRLSDDTFQVGLTVKLGPVSMQYKGQLTVTERDRATHTAVFEGRAQETRGQGTAQGTATLRLTVADGTTTGTVSADIALAGKVAAMGKSIIGGVTDQMMGLFAANLQAMVTTPTAEEPVAAESGAAGAVGEAAAGTPLPSAHHAAPAAFGASASPAPSAAQPSLNGLAIAKGVVMDQLRSPPKLLALLAAVAFVAYRLGRRRSGN